jgi:hypothetical protein
MFNHNFSSNNFNVYVANLDNIYKKDTISFYHPALFDVLTCGGGGVLV